MIDFHSPERDEDPMLHLLHYTLSDRATPERIREVFPAHQAAWQSCVADGSLVAIGPMEDPAQGALGVFRSREAAEGFAARDPFVTEGLVAEWTVNGWREVLLDAGQA